MSLRITGIGSCVPSKVVSNDDLSKFLDTSDEWITKRVGIKNRHVCTTETVTELAVNAAKRAMDDAGVTAGDIDLILASSVSGDRMLPTLSCMVQKEIGATCMTFDISAACSSFLFLLETAKAYLSIGMKRILLVCGEQMTRMVDWTDRSICVLFGDAAGAAVVEKDDTNLYESVFSVSGNDDVIKMNMPYGNSPFKTSEEPEKVMLLQMKGQETFKYAVGAMSSGITEVLAKAKLDMSDVKYIVPHQANQRILSFTSDRLGLEEGKVFSIISEYGNTSSASVPLALDIMHRTGKLKKDDIFVMAAFGGGLSSGAIVTKWTKD